MDATEGQGFEQPSPSFLTRFPSRGSSMEMTEMIPGTIGSLISNAVTLKPVTQEVSGNIERVGPWPLKRAGSSETTIVMTEDEESTLGSQDSSERGLLKEKSEFSALMDAVDWQYEQIQQQSKTPKSASNEISEVLEWTRPQLTRSPAQETRSSKTAGEAGMEGGYPPQGSELPARDTERQSDHMTHVLGSCCQHCKTALQRKRSAAIRVCWVVVACFIVLLFNPGLIAAVFSQDEKAVIVDVQGDSEKTLRLLLGLLIIPVVAVNILMATAIWSLLLHLGYQAKNISGRQSNRSMIMWFGFLICWVVFPLMACITLIGTFLITMK